MIWSWGSFWLGFVSAYVISWLGLALIIAAGRRIGRRVERESALAALTDPGVPAVDVLIALQRQREEQDARAVEDLLGSLKREA